MKTKLALLPFMLLFLSCSSNKAGFYYTTGINATLYAGVPNPLKITAFGKTPVDISIKNGSVTTHKDSTYWIKPGTDKGPVIVTFKQGKKLQEVYFHVKHFPSPILLFRGMGYPDKMIPVSEFRKVITLGYTLPDFEYPVHFQLLSFTVMVITADGKVTHYKGDSSGRLPFTYSSVSGDTIIFTNLEYKLDGSDYIFKGEDCVYTLQ